MHNDSLNKLNIFTYRMNYILRREIFCSWVLNRLNRSLYRNTFIDYLWKLIYGIFHWEIYISSIISLIEEPFLCTVSNPSLESTPNLHHRFLICIIFREIFCS